MQLRLSWIALLLASLAWIGCGPDKGDDEPGDGDARIDAPTEIDAPDVDARIDATEIDARIDATEIDAQICDDLTCTTPVTDNCVATEICNNGTDDNCNMQIDEGCLCAPGAVQACFRGPPGRRNVGSCVDGQQTCQGSGEFTMWGPCVGGIAPGAEACDSQDNNCNGCVDDDPSCCIVELACPGPGDMPDGQPFQNYVIDGTAFFSGQVQSWAWDVTGGPCDQLLLTTTNPVRQSFTLTGQTTSTLTLRPTLSGDYTVHVRIVAVGGMIYECTFIVHIGGPGVRVETCSDRTATTDIDLHVHRPNSTAGWALNTDDCHFRNCAAGAGNTLNWGYPNSPLSECVGGPQGATWMTLGYCRNPRLDIDSINANGVPENINIDIPQNNASYRVALHFWGGTVSAALPAPHPMVNIYCGGFLRGTYGQAPDVIPNFDTSGGDGLGATTGGDLWRVVDVRPTVVAGVTTDCVLTRLFPPGMTTGFWVTNERSY